MALRAEHARRLLDSELAVTRAKVALTEATRKREVERNRCRAALTPGQRLRAGGVEILVTPTTSGRTFRLKDYLYRHKLTKAMQPFVTEGTDYERWTVKALAGESEPCSS